MKLWKDFMKKIVIQNLEEIDVDQLIWDIEESNDFYIYEIENSSNSEYTNILVKIINKGNNFGY